MEKRFLEFKQKIMGGTFIIKIFPQPDIIAHKIENHIDAAFKEAQRIEDLLTDFRDSPFNQINQQAGVAPTKVNQEIWGIIQDSIDISKLTNGIFDISYASLGHLWRQYTCNNQDIPQQLWEQAKNLVDYKKIKFDHKNHTIYLPHSQMRIGLGGIGKGYAVDKMFQLLKQQGLSNFYVNGAGDIRVDSAHNAPRPWRIGIRNPFNSNPNIFAGFITLHNQACATSGSYVQQVERLDSHGNYQQSTHIIHPKHATYPKDAISATIIADTTMQADTYATTVMIMGVKQGLEFLNDQHIFGFIINKHGQVKLSETAIDQYYNQGASL